MRTAPALHALCLAGIALLCGGCSGLVAATGPDGDLATPEMRATPERYILVTVENQPLAMQTRAGSTTRGYDTAVRYKVSSRARATVQALADAYGLREVRAWPIPALHVHCVVFELAGDTDRDEVLARLASEPAVRVAQPLQTFATATSPADYDDPYLDLQRSLQQMAIPAAHRWSRGRGVTVAVVDTGVDTHHPDLAGRIGKSRNFIDRDQQRFESDRHGTRVAGLIAALAGNNEGIVGVAPEVELLAFKACWQSDRAADEALCNSFTLAQGIAAAIDAGAQVINLSIAGPSDPLLEELVAAADRSGAVVVGAVAAAQAPADPASAGPGFPARASGVIAVDSSRPRPGPSQNINAPGDDIFTLTPDGGYGFASGSSLATAQVSGVVALLLARQPRLTSREVRSLLVGATQRMPTPNGELASVNACAALATMLGVGPCPELLLARGKIPQ
jgi:subtilisin family serine protease